MEEILIAPCGMNCNICASYLALKNDVRSKGIRMAYCRGCRPRDKQCAFLKKQCPLLMNGGIKYCFECPDFPCERLRHLDQRYKTLYKMSMIENLKFIRRNDIRQFLNNEQQKWQCPECGQPISCHNGICFNCRLSALNQKRNKYRWEEGKQSNTKSEKRE